MGEEKNCYTNIDVKNVKIFRKCKEAVYEINSLMSVLSKNLECIIKTIKHKAIVYDSLKEMVFTRNQNDFSQSLSTICDMS